MAKRQKPETETNTKQDTGGKEEQAISMDNPTQETNPNEQTVAANDDATTTAPDVELAELHTELEQARAKSSEYFDGWQRERADFINYKKRVERDQTQTLNNITSEVIKKYLAIIDDMERALKTRPTQGEGAAWAEGIELIYRKLQNILESEGVTRIQADQQIFDPTLHEAITQEDSPEQQGYMLGDRVVRPALVRVAR